MPSENTTKPSPLKDDPAVSAFYEDFRVRMLEARIKADYTQEQLCELIDIPLANYKHMEGKRASKFPLHKLGRLASALRVTCDFLVTGRQRDHIKRVS